MDKKEAWSRREAAARNYSEARKACEAASWARIRFATRLLDAIVAESRSISEEEKNEWITIRETERTAIAKRDAAKREDREAAEALLATFDSNEIIHL